MVYRCCLRAGVAVCWLDCDREWGWGEGAKRFVGPAPQSREWGGVSGAGFLMCWGKGAQQTLARSGRWGVGILKG